MSRECTVCGTPFRRSDPGEHYAFCGVSGRFCRDCSGSLEDMVARWIEGRVAAVVSKHAAEQVRHDQLERELAEQRLARASLEALPLTTRAAMTGKRRRAA